MFGSRLSVNRCVGWIGRLSVKKRYACRSARGSYGPRLSNHSIENAPGGGGESLYFSALFG